MNEIKKNVLGLLKENKANEIIFDWIEDNVCGNGDPIFIRALVTAVHEYVITGSGENCKLAKLQLKTRTELLKHYIKNDEKCELQALYAIQVLTNQLGQPCGLLPQIFDVLYDSNVITGKTFKVWESSTDPNESEGKDVAVLSVNSFFIRLHMKEQLGSSPVQHHQSTMGGPVSAQQAPSMVQRGQQINPVMPFSYAPRNGSRPIPIGRNPMTTVVNQTGQQSSSHFNAHAMQMIGPTSSSFGPQMMTMYQNQVYSQGRPQYPSQYIISPPNQQYVNGFIYQPPANSNRYYPQHTIPNFSAVTAHTAQMPPQQIPAQQPPQPQQKPAAPKRTCFIVINPDTGKNIFEEESGDSGTGSATASVKELPHSPVNQRNQQDMGEEPRKIISFSSSLTQNIKLHESENAWKPLNKLSLSDIAADTLEKEKLKRSVQGVLNKLTPQKFETLLAQLKGLNIDTEEKLNVVADLIFGNVVYGLDLENMVRGPDFSDLYANLCKHLLLIKVPVAAQGGGQVFFRKLMLTKCQKEFEQDRSDELKHEMKAIGEAEPDKQKEMKHEFELKEKKLKYRQLDNIRFIGALFKLGMLIEPIMHECIKKFLSQGDEESLECLCKLLKKIGKELDDSKGSKSSRDQSPMDLYVAQMQIYVDKRLISSRVRFMLQDVIDLKKCSWVPRREENIPKTIDQIHQEAEREARGQQMNLCNMSSSNYPKRMPDDRDRRKTSGCNMLDDGWTPSSSKSNKGSYSALDPAKLKLTRPDEVETIRLGPGGRGPSSWGRGFSGVVSNSKTAAEEVKTAKTNRYSALESLTSASYDGQRGSQRLAASSLESSHGLSNQLFTATRKTSSTSKEREDLLETVKVFNKPAEAKAQDTKKNDVHGKGNSANPKEFSLRGPEYNEEDTEKNHKPLIDEFLLNNHFEKLEFPVKTTKVEPNVQMTMDEIKTKLLSLLKKNKANRLVFNWINANVSVNSEPIFIRALVTAVHEHVITGANCELGKQELKNRTALLTRYVNHNEKLELQALYAIQALMNKFGHPSGLLRQIFDILYDDDVITEETFKVWESSTDPNESEGKGVAVHSVKSFFTWLQESESGEEPEE